MDPLEAQYAACGASHFAYAAQCVVFGAVIADDMRCWTWRLSLRLSAFFHLSVLVLVL